MEGERRQLIEQKKREKRRSMCKHEVHDHAGSYCSLKKAISAYGTYDYYRTECFGNGNSPFCVFRDKYEPRGEEADQMPNEQIAHHVATIEAVANDLYKLGARDNSQIAMEVRDAARWLLEAVKCLKYQLGSIHNQGGNRLNETRTLEKRN